jgi:hypothetical protein
MSRGSRSVNIRLACRCSPSRNDRSGFDTGTDADADTDAEDVDEGRHHRAGAAAISRRPAAVVTPN